jgi:putative flippase GtrA
MFVEVFGVHELWAKILGIGCTVMWNFFLYKFFVYA